MGQKNEIDPLVEWTVWAHLDSKTDLELILLKGHLLVETILETVLKRNNILDCENYSFYRKITSLETFEVENKLKKDFIIASLRGINRMRNNLAHELHFDIGNGDFEIWTSNILQNLKGEKFTKYTYRTKIVHSFSVLSKNILEIEKRE
tara:strand:- start:123 stop:569 length:447 start_codon:yes stop_codon:yes gene_type:complete